MKSIRDAVFGGRKNLGVKAENLIWIFGTARTGSTWLASMMGEQARVWDEPLIGELFGNFYYVWASEHHRKRDDFVLGGDRRRWIPAVRAFVMETIERRFSGENLLIIKEPNGSLGAPLLMEALPESRMVLLVRDPRDVVASTLKATRSWFDKDPNRRREIVPDEEDSEAFAPARKYAMYISASKDAYDAHEGPKALLRYEDLRRDPLKILTAAYESLELNTEGLEATISKHAWENVPETKKGEGRFYRKATPGGWREDLTPEQIHTIERTTAPLLREFYPEEAP